MAKKFIAGAIRRPGELHRKLGISQGKKIPLAKILAAANAPGQLGQEARFAETLRKIRNK